MCWGIVVLVGLAVNLDSLCTVIRYGLANRRVTMGTNLVIALFSGAFAGAACAIAHWMTGGAAAPVAGALVLAGLGAYALCGANARPGDQDEPDGEPAPLGGWETAVLGVSLATNCLGGSFALGLCGASWLWVGAPVALCSLAMVGIGGMLGARGAKPCGAGRLSAASGLMLVLAAVLQLVL